MKRQYIKPTIEVISAYTDADVMDNLAPASYSQEDDNTPNETFIDDGEGDLELCAKRHNPWTTWD